jgi:glucokinase
LFVVVTGLPGSGKTTIGRLVAEALALPLFDKDEVLEALFEALGVGDETWRARMSRAADQVLMNLVTQSPGAVVVSWWKHPRSESASGTDSGWLSALPGKVLELHCRCSAEVAIERFFNRNRHPGHLDELKVRSDELAKFKRAAALGPLGVGPVVVCNTELPQNVPAIVRALDEHAG